MQKTLHANRTIKKAERERERIKYILNKIITLISRWRQISWRKIRR